MEGLPLPGEVVGQKYRIETMLGSGGIGVVLGATDLSLSRTVALKFLLPKSVQRSGLAARFHREARAVAALESEHVARVFEVATMPNGAPYIVMEHLRGCDLAKLVHQSGVLPFTDAVDFVLQTCEALSEAHGRGIIHRDLKPQNLFLTERRDGSPCIKVLDFGISKVDGDEAIDLTSPETVMGTPQYMSPEQVRSLKEVDHRTDIWALGSVLFYLLGGVAPFTAPTQSAIFAMIAMNPPASIRALRSNVPPGLEAIIIRCLHKDPAGRFRDVAELAHALAPFASQVGQLSVGRVTRIVHGGASQSGSGFVASAFAMGPQNGPPPAYAAPTTVPSSSHGHFAPPAAWPMAAPAPAPTTMVGVHNTHTFGGAAGGGPSSSKVGLLLALGGVFVAVVALLGAGTFAVLHYDLLGSANAAPAVAGPGAKAVPSAGAAVDPRVPADPSADPKKVAAKPGAAKPTSPGGALVTPPGVTPPGVTPPPSAAPSATPPPVEHGPPKPAAFIYEPAYTSFSQNELAILRGLPPRVDKCVAAANGKYHAGDQITFWVDNRSETSPAIVTTSTGLPGGDEPTRVCLASIIQGVKWEMHSPKRRFYFNL